MKAISKAHQEVINERDLIHSNWEKIQDEESTAVAYLRTINGVIDIEMYSGRRRKKDQSARVASAEMRDSFINSHFKTVRNNEAYTRNRRTATRVLQVGDVLKSTWGYDQQNVDFYQVVELIGKTMVKICQIAAEKTEQDMTGTTTPVIDKFIGEPIRLRAFGDHVDISSFQRARLLKPAVVHPDGTREYSPSFFSSYA